ncbi:MAG: hypothetical protein QOH81_1822 [Sphingomonadales bacterium]|jgi:hypothetical protein|nr:hypothetical protein [Sphingomonadales bacterium]
MTGHPPLYAVFGLRIRSEIALPELPAAATEGAPHVEIRFGGTEAPDEGPAGYSVSDAGTLLRIADVGRFLIRDGREILVEPAPDASARNLRLFLLGSALGALLHQRGLLPLHANAIELDGRAVAFSGHSGAGKSTIAAWFHDRGHRILSDDVCVIGFDEAGRALAYPGIPRLRLWREALEASGRTAGEYDRSFDAMDKYDVPSERRSPAPLPLAAIYLLRQAEEGTGAASIERLQGVDSVETLISNTYRGAYLKTIGRTGEHLAACLRIARMVPVFRAARLWGFDRFEEQALRLDAHAREQVEAAKG